MYYIVHSEVEKISDEAIQPYKITKHQIYNGYKYPLEVLINCPNCDYVNRIEVEYSEDFFNK